MARYNLIIRDRTYFSLMEIGTKENKSIGRLLNDIIETYVLDYNGKSAKLSSELTVQCMIKTCLNQADHTVINDAGYEKFVCSKHLPLYIESGKWRLKA